MVKKKNKLCIQTKIGIIFGALLVGIIIIVLLCKCRSEKYSNKTIFVSIASYRDNQCQTTLKDLFEKAKHPKNITVGICDQFKEQTELCGIVDKYKNQIRTIKLASTEAKGPLYARALIQSLYLNENYFLMIDSHSKFSKNWDVDLIVQIEELQNKHGVKKPILSSYPKDYKDMNNDLNFTLCKTINISDGFPGQFDSVAKKNKNKFKQSMFIAGGFTFSIGDFALEVRYPASLAFIFSGEEILLSYFAYCMGYDIFSQKKNCIFHNYNLTGRHQFTNDNAKQKKQVGETSNDNLKKLLFEIEPRSVADRNPKDFWKKIGWDFSKKKIDPKVEIYWCNDGKEF
jgi:hypothetical protein